MAEFIPGMMYNEQIMRMFPKEMAIKFKVMPSFEETLIKMS